MNSQVPATSDTETSKRLVSPTTWKPWTRQVVFRFTLLLGAYAFWLGYLIFATTFHWASDQNRGATSTARRQTMYQSNPALSRAIVEVAALAFLVETASILWRGVRHSYRFGVTGMVVAGFGGVAAVLGMLTIGPFIAPFAVICLVLALPIGSKTPTVTATPSIVPPGWFVDPTDQTQWSYWDGRAWTSHVGVMPDRVAPVSRHDRS